MKGQIKTPVAITIVIICAVIAGLAVWMATRYRPSEAPSLKRKVLEITEITIGKERKDIITIKAEGASQDKI